MSTLFHATASQLRVAVLLSLAASAPVLAQTAFLNEPIKPLPDAPVLDAEKVLLGETLFNDKRLSHDNSIACSNCHVLGTGGVDRRQVSLGIRGSKGVVNAPTVFNSSLNFRQFWDGRANSLEEQASGPINNVIEMGSSWPEVVRKLSSDKAISARFAKSYGHVIDAPAIQDALATFQRSLLTPNSRFDQYLKGNATALNAEERKGYQLFKSYGCVACHQGMNAGGNMFQLFGVMGDYFAKRGNPTAADMGRFNITNNPADKHVFKVPSLRNIAATPPYFHDGSAKTLGDAVDVMFRFQLGRPAPQADKDLIVRFLYTLTGEYKGHAIPVVPLSAQLASSK
jgi:cytochrome c peroxidase